MHHTLPHVEIPPPLRDTLVAARGEEFVANGWAYEALAIRAYQQGLISRGKLRSLLGMGFHEGDAYLKQLGIPYNYTIEDFEQDMVTLEKWFGK